MDVGHAPHQSKNNNDKIWTHCYVKYFERVIIYNVDRQTDDYHCIIVFVFYWHSYDIIKYIILVRNLREINWQE